MAGYYDSYDDGARGVGTVGLVRIAGAVSSAALVVGLGLWGYKIAVRDAMGVPVVRALEGAMRVAPAAPGGTVTAHQGLAVNAVAALGVATPLPDSLTLAPRAVDLAEDDAPGLVQDGATALLTASAGLEDPATLLLRGEAAEAEAPARADVGGAIAASPAPVEVELAAPGPVPEDAIAAAVAEAVVQSDEVGAQVVPAPMAATIRPQRRPGSLRAAEAVPATAAAEPFTAPVLTVAQEISANIPAKVNPAALAIGTPLVQLGAFDTPEEAQAEWAKLAGQFPDLSGHAMVIQAATAGGGTFYRLRASGFESDDVSRKFCTVLLAADTPCIPVAHR